MTFDISWLICDLPCGYAFADQAWPRESSLTTEPINLYGQLPLTVNWRKGRRLKGDRSVETRRRLPHF